jgi:hypothetical protein
MSPEEEEDWSIPDPTIIERLIAWAKILWTVRTTVMILLGIGAVSVGGNIAEVNPWKEAAIEVGLIDPEELRPAKTDPGIPTDVLWEAIANQAEDMDLLSELIGSHTHPALDLSHEHELQAHSHDYAKVKHNHPIPEQELTGATKEFIAATVKTQIETLVPPNHLKLH